MRVRPSLGWLEDVSELAACVDEEWARRDIAFTVKTDDPALQQSRLDWIREIRPRWQTLRHRLEAAYLANPYRRALPPRYRVFDRLTDTLHALYREGNLSLLVTEAELEQAYEKQRAAMTIMYEGREYTPQQAVLFLESPDRALRQTVWTLLAERALAGRDAFDELFDRLLAVRSQIARNADFGSYRDYAFRALGRFDYGPAECLLFHEAVEAHFVPLAGRVASDRCALMGVAPLRPWDEDVDPIGRPALPGFERVEDLLDRCEAVFRAVAPEFGGYVRFMREKRLFDLDRRRGKASLAYCRSLEERRWPFVFSNVAPAREVLALFHECGHAFHYILVREEPLITYRSAPIDFNEVASTSMELLTAPYLDLVYDAPGDARRAYRALLQGIVTDMPRIAMVDAFQHWLYTHPAHTAKERRRAWTALYRRFHPDVDWSGCKDVLASWHTEPGGAAIFLRPFYYIEYGISLLAALQLWRRAIEGDMAGTVASYRSALALGGSRPLPELYEAAGLHFAFDAETVAPVAASLARALDKMPYGA